MTAISDMKAVIETLSGSPKTNEQLTRIGDAIASLCLGRGRVAVRLAPLHFTEEGAPIPFADLTGEQKAQLVKRVLIETGKEAVFQGIYMAELDSAEDTARANAEAGSSDFEEP